MDGRTANLFRPVQEEELTLRGRLLRLTPPTAAQVQAAQGEAELLHPRETERALCSNACLLAQVLADGAGRVFASGAQVLDTLTPGEIGSLSQRLAQLSAQSDPGLDTIGLPIQDYQQALAQDTAGRLRWRVLRAFHALPSEARVQQMKERDYLYCILNLVLDQEEELAHLCPSCRQRAEEHRCTCCGTPLGSQQTGENPSFDRQRFEALRKGAAE